MATDLHDVLARGAAVPARDPDVDAIWERGRTRRATRRVALVAVPCVLLAMVASVAVLVSSNRSGHVRTGPATSAAQLQAGWSRQPDAIDANTFVNDAAAGPTGFVAVGYEFAPGGSVTEPTRVAVWNSPDGSAWSRVAPDILPTNATALDTVAYWQGHFWAVGTGPDGAEYWSSADGNRWHEESNGLLSLPLHRLLADARGLVAYGDGVALNPDGLHWVPGDLPGMVVSVTPHGPTLVALVREPATATSGRAVVYTSSDALHWTRVADLGVTADPGGTALTSWNGALWAATSPGAPDRTTIWRSADGTTWTPDPTSAPAGTTFDTLIASGPYLVATGFDTQSRPGGWVSTDGTTWVGMPQLDRPSGGRLDVAASDGATVVALSTSELRDTYRWVVPTG